MSVSYQIGHLSYIYYLFILCLYIIKQYGTEKMYFQIYFIQKAMSVLDVAHVKQKIQTQVFSVFVFYLCLII